MCVIVLIMIIFLNFTIPIKRHEKCLPPSAVTLSPSGLVSNCQLLLYYEPGPDRDYLRSSLGPGGGCAGGGGGPRGDRKLAAGVV